MRQAHDRAMDKRPYYRTKAEWAAAQASALRQQARLLPICNIHDWRGVKRRTTAVRTLDAEARRMDRLAERFRAQGV